MLEVIIDVHVFTVSVSMLDAIFCTVNVSMLIAILYPGNPGFPFDHIPALPPSHPFQISSLWSSLS